jgi:hypothetical protein
MMNKRLEQLLQFLEEDPTDPFVIYGVALEIQKTDVQKSEQYFDRLLTEFSDYLPAYYHAAKLKAGCGKRIEALTIYTRGIALAKQLQNAATQRELQSAHDELIFEMDDETD